VLKRFVLLLTVAVVMLAMSALPALARTTGIVCCGEPSKNGSDFILSTNDHHSVIKTPLGSLRY
jgi:hypothetical protein